MAVQILTGEIVLAESYLPSLIQVGSSREFLGKITDDDECIYL
jgi:hypothetical protein